MPKKEQAEGRKESKDAGNTGRAPNSGHVEVEKIVYGSKNMVDCMEEAIRLHAAASSMNL